MNKHRLLADLVDMECYPLLDDAAFAPVVDNARRQPAESSFANLPGFLKAGVAEEMTQEVMEALPRAYRREKIFSAYGEAGSEHLPVDHVRRRKHLNRQYVVTTDVLTKSGAVRALYDNDIFTGRVAQMLAEPALYRLADPVMACTSTIMSDGDTHGWHFDLNDFVVSILLQAPEAGGTFDFAPSIRSEEDENYAGVASVLDGTSQRTRSIKVGAGTLLLFCGRRAIHRVAPIQGKIPRVIALFSYDRQPNVRYGGDEYERVVGRRTVFET